MLDLVNGPYNKIIGSEAWDKPTWQQRTTSYKWGVKNVGPWISYQGPNAILGHNLGTLCTDDKKRFVPGHFRVKPIIHYRATTMCASSAATCRRYTYGDMRDVLDIQGPIAALVPGSVSGVWLSPHNFTADDEYALLRAVARSHETPVLLGVTLAEAGETLDMLGGSMSKTLRQLKKLKPPGALGRGKRAFDFATSKWMEYRYGIMPTIFEVDAYRKLYASKLNVEFGPILKSRAGEGLPSTSVQPFTGTPNGGWYAIGTRTTYTHERLTATVYTRRKFTTASSLGVDLSDLPSTLYELVTLSFVLDWVYDVGTWLRAVVPRGDTQHLGSTLSFSSEQSLTTVVSHVGLQAVASAIYPHTICGSECRNVRRTYQRLINQSLPKYPHLRVPTMGLERKLDSLSLMWQNATRLLPRR